MNVNTYGLIFFYRLSAVLRTVKCCGLNVDYWLRETKQISYLSVFILDDDTRTWSAYKYKQIHSPFLLFFFVYSSCTFANSCNSNYFIFTVVSRFTFFSFFSFVFSLCSYSLFDYSLSLWMLLSVYACARWLKGSDRHRIYWYW